MYHPAKARESYKPLSNSPQFYRDHRWPRRHRRGRRGLRAQTKNDPKVPRRCANCGMRRRDMKLRDTRLLDTRRRDMRLRNKRGRSSDGFQSEPFPEQIPTSSTMTPSTRTMTINSEHSNSSSVPLPRFCRFGDVETEESPDGGAQYLEGDAARSVHAHSEKILQVIFKVAGPGSENPRRYYPRRYYRAILQGPSGQIHLAGGHVVLGRGDRTPEPEDEPPFWATLDYGLRNALIAVNGFLPRHQRPDNHVAVKFLKGRRKCWELWREMKRTGRW